jgi:predicted transcriptional regulator
MPKVNVTCRLETEEVAVLDRLAELMDRDRSYLIKQAVSEFIAHRQWQISEVEAAVRDADAGDFASEKDVRLAFREPSR